MGADEQFTFKLTCEACPTQAEGMVRGPKGGNPVFWYFRARHGHWTLSVGASPEAAVLGHEIASGEDPTHGYMDQGAVYPLVFMLLNVWVEAQ